MKISSVLYRIIFKVKCLNDGAPVDPGDCGGDSMPSSDEDCNIQECVEASGDGSEDTSEAPDAEGGGREWFYFYSFCL